MLHYPNDGGATQVTAYFYSSQPYQTPLPKHAFLLHISKQVLIIDY
jgi:hypothetical protein